MKLVGNGDRLWSSTLPHANGADGNDVGAVYDSGNHAGDLEALKQRFENRRQIARRAGSRGGTRRIRLLSGSFTLYK